MPTPDPDVTERWSGRAGYKRGVLGNRAWDIDGASVTNAEEARAALLSIYPDAGVNGAFPLDNRLLGVDEPIIEPIGPRAWLGKQIYQLPPTGQWQAIGNPLDRPPRILWRPGRTEEPSFIDANGVNFVDTAGIPFDPPPAMPVIHRFLTITRWESTYDVAKSEEFENTVNEESVLGPLTPGPIAPGRMMLLSYVPMEAYDETSTMVPVQYDFEVWRGSRLDDDGLWDSFKYRMLSAGFTAWYDDSGTKKRGPIVFKDNSVPQNPVALTAAGRPIDDNSYRVRNGAGVPVVAVQAPDEFQHPNELLEQVSNYVFIKFSKALKKDFAGLNLF
jgi:hypothetical protein